MKNTSIFKQFDMVVSITEQTINDQLAHLQKMGMIPRKLILVQFDDGRDYTYKILADENQIPQNCAYICADVVPQVVISSSNSTVTFVLKMVSGRAGFFVGSMRKPQVKTANIDNWKYGIDVDLDLRKLRMDDIGEKIKVPELINDQLAELAINMADVKYLLMNFESADFRRFNPTHTHEGLGDVTQLVFFMNFYFKWFFASGNPFVLGYAINQTDYTVVSEDRRLPHFLAPADTTYSLYYDGRYPAKSNLNFISVNRTGSKQIAGKPERFDTNWLRDDEKIDGKIIISHTNFVEEFILKPIYETLRNSVYDQIRGKIDVPIGNDYQKGKTATGSGFSYVISDIRTGDNHYVNTMDVTFVNKETSADIVIKGHVGLYKNVETNLGACKAITNVAGDIQWKNTITIKTVKDARGRSQFDITANPVVEPPISKSYANNCAKVLGPLLEELLSFFRFGKGPNVFVDMIHVVLNIPVNLGNNQYFKNIPHALGAVVLLPDGRECNADNPFIDPEGNFSLQLSYKTLHAENAQMATVSESQQPVE